MPGPLNVQTLRVTEKSFLLDFLFKNLSPLKKTKTVSKEYLVAGLIHCADCSTRMNPSQSNKPKKCYYYYRCFHSLRAGKNSCAIKEVNAQRVEDFLISSLLRISRDNQFIHNLAFKLAHEIPGRSRIELSYDPVKNLETSISQVLIDFQNGLKDKSQIEKCLIIRKTIEKIAYRKESLEVVISLRDRKSPLIGQDPLMESAKMAARIREGCANLSAPAWKPNPTSSIENSGAEGQNRTAHACLFRAALYH